MGSRGEKRIQMKQRDFPPSQNNKPNKLISSVKNFSKANAQKYVEIYNKKGKRGIVKQWLPINLYPKKGVKRDLF